MAKREHETVKPQPSRIGKKSVTVYLPEDKWRELKVLAATTDTTIDALMRRGVDLVLAEQKTSKPPKR
jgi:ribosomal protein L1